MTFTYLLGMGLASAAIDQVRFRLRDTAEDGHVLEDEEIAWAVTEAGTPLGAAILIAESLGAQGGSVIRKRVGDVQIEYDPNTYRELATLLRAQQARTAGIPKAGGISVADKQRAETDTDAVRPAFSRELFRAPGTDNRIVTPTWPATGL